MGLLIMKFKEMVDRVDWEDVKGVMLRSYCPEDEDRSMEPYKVVLDEIRSLVPKDCEGMRLYVEWVKDKDDEYIHVFGKDGKLQKESSDFKHMGIDINDPFANTEVTYALEMEPWEKWLDMNIETTVMVEFSIVEIVAACLYEMTFMGFTQEKIEEKREDLRKRVEDFEKIKDDPEKMKEKFVSWDEVKEKLRKKFPDQDFGDLDLGEGDQGGKN